MTTYKELAERLEETMHDDAGFHLAVDEAIEILRSLDAQKPIGYWGGAFSIEGGADLYEVEQVSAFGRVYKNLPLYATPQRPQWIGLTDSEIDSLQATTGARDDDIRIIEAALRAKNGVAA